MKESTYLELMDLLQSFSREKAELQKNIESNNMQIHEAQCFADEILGKDEDDFNVFSPRKYEDLYRTELDLSYGKKSNFERQNAELNEKCEKLDKMIQLFQSIISESKSEEDAVIEEEKNKIAESEISVQRKIADLEAEEEKHNRIAQNLKNSVMKDLDHVLHKLELSYKFMGQDIMRSKMELKSVTKSLNKVMDDMNNMIFDLCPLGVDYEINLKDSLKKLLQSFNQDDKYELETKIEIVSCENKITSIILYKTIRYVLFSIRKFTDAKKIMFYCEQVEQDCVVKIGCDGKITVEKEIEIFNLQMKNLKEKVCAIGGSMEAVIEEDQIKVTVGVPLVLGF